MDKKNVIALLIFVLLVICINAKEINPLQPEMVMIDSKTASYTDPIFKDKFIVISTDKEVYRCLLGCNIKVKVNNTYIDKAEISNLKISYQDETGQIVYGTKFKEGLNATQFKELEYFRENDVNEYMFPVEVPAGLGETKFNIVLENDGKEFVLDPAITSGCTESNAVIECMGALTGNWIDTDNSSIYIHDAVITATDGDYLRLNTTHGWINISNNVTINSYSADAGDCSGCLSNNLNCGSAGNPYIHLYANSSNNIIINDTTINNYGGEGGSGGTCTLPEGCNGGALDYVYGGGGGGNSEIVIYRGNSITITNSTIYNYGGQSGDGATHTITGDNCAATYNSNPTTIAGSSNFTSHIPTDIQQTIIYDYGGYGGKGVSCGCTTSTGTTCTQSRGGSGGASVFKVNFSDLDTSNVSIISYSGKRGVDGTYSGGCNSQGDWGGGNPDNGNSLLQFMGSSLNFLSGIIINGSVADGSGVDDVGRSKIYFESDFELLFTNQTVYGDQPATNYHIINLTNDTVDRLGVFDTDFQQTTYVYCSAPDIVIGNDTTLDTDLDFTNCPAYADGNISYVTYDQYTGILENPWIEIGTIDGTREWSRDYGFTGPETITLTTTSINEYLRTCTPDENNSCRVPITVYSDATGTLQKSSINITYNSTWTNQTERQTNDFSSPINTYLASCTADSQGNCQVPLIWGINKGKLKAHSIYINYTIQPNVIDFASTIQSYINGCALQSSGRCQIYLNISSDKAGILQLSNINLSYVGGKIINLPYGRAVFELNKSHKATELEASGVKEIYIGRDNSLLSGNYTGIVYINYSLDSDTNFSWVYFNTSRTSKKAVMHGFNDTAILNTSLLIPKETTFGCVYICPNITSLDEVNLECSGRIDMVLGGGSQGMNVSNITIEGEEYYLISNITGTGGGENNPPNITNPIFNPDPVYYNDNINASVTYTDDNLDNGTVFFNWTVNNAQISFTNQTNIQNGTTLNDSLSESNFNGGDNVTLYAYAYDGSNYTDTKITSRIIIGCGMNVTSDLILTKDLDGAGYDTCLTITANGADVYCDGHSITGDYIGVGLHIEGDTSKLGILVDGTTTNRIDGCILTQFAAGIHASHTHHTYIGLLSANYIHDCVTYGIYYEDAPTGRLANSYIYNNFYNVYLNNADGMLIFDNYIYDADTYGIRIHGGSTSNSIYDNSIHSNAETGIYLSSASNGNYIYDNDISDNMGNGIVLYNLLKYSKVYNNNINNNTGKAIFLLYGSDDNEFYDNRLDSNGIGFVSRATCTGNEINNTNISNSADYGVYVDSGSAFDVTNSKSIGSGVYDVFLEDSSTLTLNNTKIGQRIKVDSSTFTAYNLTIEEPYGEINYFNETISITSDRDTTNNLNISSNSIFVNSTNIPEFNKTAELTFNSLAWGVATPTYEPDDITPIECPAGICTNKTFSAGILKYTVNHFTTYSSMEGDTTDPTFNTPTTSIPLDTEHNITFSVTISDANYDNTTLYITSCDEHFQNCTVVSYDVPDYTGSRTYSYTLDKSFFYSTKGLHGIPYQYYFTHEDLSGNVGTSSTLSLEISYFCGNGKCEEGESPFVCSADCGAVQPGQGNPDDVQPVKLIIPEYLTHFYPLEELLKAAEEQHLLYNWLHYEDLPLSAQKEVAGDMCPNRCVSDTLYFGGQVVNGSCIYETTECEIGCMAGRCTDCLKFCNDKVVSDWKYTGGFCTKGICSYSQVEHCELGCLEEDVFEGVVPLVSCSCVDTGEQAEKASHCCSGFMENNVCIAEKEIGVNIRPESIYLKGILNKSKKKSISIYNTGEINLSINFEVESQYQKYFKPVKTKPVGMGELVEIGLEFNIFEKTKSFNLDVLIMTDTKRIIKTLPITLKGVPCYELGYDDCNFDSDCCSGYCSEKSVCIPKKVSPFDKILEKIKKPFPIAILTAVIILSAIGYGIFANNKKKSNSE